jgi:signal transduction histidine kinase/ligand-binding sensor domain-containing protein/DNA-binding NarL/FixJ family response regulator
MRPLRLVVIILLVMMMTVQLSSQHSRYLFHHIYTKEGLYASDVYKIIQDRQGFIWLGTGNGLYRYDGYNFKAYMPDPEDSASISGTVVGVGGTLLEDDHGLIWAGTGANGLCLYDPVTDKFTRFYYDPDQSNLLTFPVTTHICQDSGGVVWIGTIWGLVRYDRETNGFSIFRRSANPDDLVNYVNRVIPNKAGHLWVSGWDSTLCFDKQEQVFTDFRWPGSDRQLDSLHILEVYEESDSVTWYGTATGLYKHEIAKERATRYLIGHQEGDPTVNPIRRIVADPAGNHRYLWILADGQLCRFDKLSGISVMMENDPGDPNSIGYNFMHDICSDRNGILWIGKESGGVDLLSNKASPFEYHALPPVPPDEDPYTAVSFLKDSRDHLWIGAHPAGLIHFDKDLEFVELHQPDPDDPNSLRTWFVYSMLEDREGNLWIGNTMGGLHLYDKKSKNFKRCRFVRPDNFDASQAYISDIFQDSHGDLWVGQNFGIYHLDKYAGEVPVLHLIPDYKLGAAMCRSIAEDTSGNLWFGSQGGGLLCLTPDNRKDTVMVSYVNDPEDPLSLSDNNVMSVYADAMGNIWAGTLQGLNKYLPGEDRFKRFSSKNGLEANKIFCITGDRKGNLWLSTEKGIIRFSPEAQPGRMTKQLDMREGLPFEENYQYQIYQDNDGYIYVGGMRLTGKGYYRFHPDSLLDNASIPPVVITDFKVRNRPYRTDTSIVLRSHIILDHKENFFSFEFSALDFTNPSKNLYAYMLEGLEDDWVYSGLKHSADYTSVPPGKYCFRVRGSNNDGIWNETGASLRVTVLPPWWREWWAYLLYALFLVALLATVARFYLKRQKLLHRLAVERVEKEKLAELDHLKSRFFANISHEFRTPLTLILGPVGRLKKKMDDHESLQDLDIMQRNARRLQKLINQLLNLSRLEAGRMELKAREENIAGLCRMYMQSFESLARQKNIELIFESDREEMLLFVDREMLEDILSNLLSNAFKFTPAGGRIRVSVKELEQEVAIIVEDTGTGIQPERLPRIFDRFYQADDAFSKQAEGTGIGLALVQELVRLHRGKTKVESEPGKGTRFSVFFRKGTQHLEPGEIVSGPATLAGITQEETGDEEPFLPQENGKQSAGAKKKLPLVLVVEDNADLRTYIRSYLDTGNRILEAAEGQAGYDTALQTIPDLVITDVMMPGMDGMELCRKLKTDERTSHIPVIMLTALASLENRLEGLETGADDFITKPFEPQELSVRVNNLILQRQRLREKHWRDFELLGRLPGAAAVSLEQQFLQKARKIVEENLSDPGFGVTEFSQAMNLSRVQLHRKLKGLINQPASIFIRTIRLMKAEEMLAAKSGNVSQVAYEVGFNNLSWFAECFRQQFGVLPSDYAGRPR